MFITALLTLICSPATCPPSGMAVVSFAPQQKTADEILDQIVEQGDKAPAKLFDQLGQLKTKEGYRALVSAIERQKKVDKRCRAMHAMKYFNGVDKLEDDALDFLRSRVDSNGSKTGFHAAMTLGEMWPAASKDLVEIALDHRSLDCRTVALMHLVERDLDVDGMLLKKLAASKDVMVRYEAVLKNLRLQDFSDEDAAQKVVKAVLKAAQSKKVAERLAAVEYLRTAELAPRYSILEARMSDKDPRVNRKCLNVLEQLGSAEAVGILVRRMEVAEVGERWRTAEALRRLTGMSFGTTAKPWMQWWAREKDSFRPRGAAGENANSKHGDETGASFYGLSIRAQHLVFTVDSSDSMKAEMSKGRSRMDIAKEQLQTAIAALPEGSTFDIVNFGKNADSWAGVLVDADTKARRDAHDHIGKMRLSWGTQFYEGLRAAFEDPRADAIVVLTDGDPQLTLIMDRNLIRRMVVQWNRTRHVQIDCITIGTDRNWLRKIAEATGGRYKKVE